MELQAGQVAHVGGESLIVDEGRAVAGANVLGNSGADGSLGVSAVDEVDIHGLVCQIESDVPLLIIGVGGIDSGVDPSAIQVVGESDVTITPGIIGNVVTDGDSNVSGGIAEGDAITKVAAGHLVGAVDVGWAGPEAEVHL